MDLHISGEKCKLAYSAQFPEQGWMAYSVQFLSARKLLGCSVQFLRERQTTLQDGIVSPHRTLNGCEQSPGSASG